MFHPRSRALIISAFESLGSSVIRHKALKRFFAAHALDWGLSRYDSFERFLEWCLTKNLTKQTLAFPTRPVDFYVWGSLRPFDLHNAVSSRAFLSHFTAALIHGLTDEVPKILYISDPQKPKQRRRSPLEQDAILRAMSRPARVTTDRAELDGLVCVRLTPVVPEGLVVAREIESSRSRLRVSTIERVLIEAVLAPGRCGGIESVLQIYRAAATSGVSTNALMRLLRGHDLLYPYAHAVGWLMEMAGFGPRALSVVRREMSPLDFFLVRGERASMSYNSTWRIYVPTDLAERR